MNRVYSSAAGRGLEPAHAKQSSRVPVRSGSSQRKGSHGISAPQGSGSNRDPAGFVIDHDGTRDTAIRCHVRPQRAHDEGMRRSPQPGVRRRGSVRASDRSADRGRPRCHRRPTVVRQRSRPDPFSGAKLYVAFTWTQPDRQLVDQRRSSVIRTAALRRRGRSRISGGDGRQRRCPTLKSEDAGGNA
jgi:hypothetical protein